MRFVLVDGSPFEIPDQWWIEAEMGQFQRDSEAYAYKPDDECPDGAVSLVRIARIKPFYRLPHVTHDFGGFDHDRMIDVLKGIAQRHPMPPIRLSIEPRGLLEINPQYDYAGYDGFHRFHASIAAGFPQIPAIIAKWGRELFEG